jgi:phosphoadenosine phosphosulfate reductase
MNIYDMIVKKSSLPTRKIRFCCSLLKEQAGKGTVTLLGIRADESVNRSKRKEVEIFGEKGSSEIIDQWNNRQETTHTCIGGKDKIMIAPILNWTFSDVWKFIRRNNLPYCKLYDEGFYRIGCIFCPMASAKIKQRERLKYPGIERAYKRAIARLVSEHGTYSQLNYDVDEIFNWWISNMSIKKYLAKKQQPKLNF